jgi:sugar lactone lactonase YvrE
MDRMLLQPATGGSIRAAMLSRRAFLSLAATPVAARRPEAAAQPPPLQPADVALRRPGKVEIAFKSPGPRPNGLQATADGLWIIDQAPGSRAYLVRYDDGQVIRSFETDTALPSGITFDGQGLWIGSTFSYENVRVDAATGAVLDRKPTPGCTTYAMAGDPAPRRSPLAPPPAAPAAAPAMPASATAAGAPRARIQPNSAPARLSQQPHIRFQGPHGQEWRDGRLWTTATCSRAIYEIDAATWVVQRQLAAPGPRPHGLAWEGRYLWHNDGDLHAVFKYDLATGRIVERIQLADGDPLSHGLTIWNGTLWYCDDVGVICRLAL